MSRRNRPSVYLYQGFEIIKSTRLHDSERWFASHRLKRARCERQPLGDEFFPTIGAAQRAIDRHFELEARRARYNSDSYSITISAADIAFHREHGILRGV